MSPRAFLPTDCSEALGQQFTVENRPGAGGTIAGGIAAKAPKDGYTIASPSAWAIRYRRSRSSRFLTTLSHDFAPVGIFTNSAFVVVVPKNSPATDIKSLVDYVNKQPGKLNYSTVGLGSTQHLIAEHLRQRASINAQAVSYRTTGEVVSALLRGDAAFAVELYHPIRGQVDSGDLADYRGGDTPSALAGDSQCADSGGEWRNRNRLSRLVWSGVSSGHAAANRRQASQGDEGRAGQGCRQETA